MTLGWANYIFCLRQVALPETLNNLLIYFVLFFFNSLGGKERHLCLGPQYSVLLALPYIYEHALILRHGYG